MQIPFALGRRELLQAGFAVVAAQLWPELVFPGVAFADDKKQDDRIGRREIIKGLDGMSRVADAGNNPFGDGHSAAAVMSSAFFCREQKLGDDVQKEMLALVETRHLSKPLYAVRPNETSDPKLIDGLLDDLNAGITTLRRSGHNIIFAVTSMKALREVPEAATPERIDGLRKMVQSFGKDQGKPPEREALVDLADEQKFIHFVFEEFLKAMDLYLIGKGHHGYAGHVLTIGHALVELSRMGHKDLAQKGMPAYWQFVREARSGADLGGKTVAAAPPHAPTPLTSDYWVEQNKHKSGLIISSHLIKYPYSFYALAKEVRDEDLKRRILDKVYHLTAIS
jgi:hypothetical protein